MEELTARDWFGDITPAITSLLFAVTVWLGPRSLSRTRALVLHAGAILFALASVYEELVITGIHPVVRVIRVLCLAVFVLTIILCWPRKKT